MEKFERKIEERLICVMKQITGDLIKMAKSGRFEVIVHGCNCHRTMGAGIARQIAKEFPEAYDVDQNTMNNRLGQISIAVIDDKLTVVNAYTQNNYSGPGVKADYAAIRSCFKKIKHSFSGLKIGYPKIGAGLAGGDWEIISKIIDEELAGEDHTLVVYDK